PLSLHHPLRLGNDELLVRDRARTVGAHELGCTARARGSAASGRVDAVRAGAVLLPPLRRRRVWTGSARIRATAALGAAMARAAGGGWTGQARLAPLAGFHRERAPLPPGGAVVADEP